MPQIQFLHLIFFCFFPQILHGEFQRTNSELRRTERQTLIDEAGSALVRDLLTRLQSYGSDSDGVGAVVGNLNYNLKSNTVKAVAAAEEDTKKGMTEDQLQPQEIIWDIWQTISHYWGRNDLNSLERLEDIGKEILSGFSEREKDTVFFYLYNRGRYDGQGSDTIKYGALSELKKSSFVRQRPVKFLIHGFKMNGFSHFSYLLKDAYLKNGEECNVISVDWRRLAGDYVYFNAAFNTRIVGERIGELIVFLKRNGFIDSYDQIHLVGFSLGAHVAGYAGKYIIKTERQQIARISGLDPAGPSFDGSTSDNRLDKNDAKFVDVIHTSAGKSGITESIGHLDFFPKGGAEQPNCDWERISDFFLRNCSHERSFYLYLETIRGKKYIGCPCKSWEDFQTAKCNCGKSTKEATIMGEFCDTTARGDRFLYAKGTFPSLTQDR